MSEDEIKAKLRDMGIDPDDPTWTPTRAVDLGKVGAVSQAREALEKVKSLLEAQVQSDLEQIQTLREHLARMKRGGGR